MTRYQTGDGTAEDAKRLIREGYIPGTPAALATAVAGIDVVAQLRATPPKMPDYTSTLHGIQRHLEKHGTMPDDWLDQLMATDQVTARVDRFTAALSSLAMTLDRRFEHLVKIHRDTLLDGLRTKLEPITTALRAAYPVVGGIDLDAPDATVVARASAEVRDALVAVADLTDEYVRLRRAQYTVHAVNAPQPANSAEPWRTVAAQGILELSELESPGLPDAGLGRRAAVRAVVERDDLWLPTTRELDAAWFRIVNLPQPDADSQDGDDNGPRGDLMGAMIAVTAR